MELEEKDAQDDCRKFMDDAKAKRAEDSKSQSDKEGALAETTGQLVTDEEGLKNKKIDLMETEKALGGLESTNPLAMWNGHCQKPKLQHHHAHSSWSFFLWWCLPLQGCSRLHRRTGVRGALSHNPAVHHQEGELL